MKQNPSNPCRGTITLSYPGLLGLSLHCTSYSYPGWCRYRLTISIELECLSTLLLSQPASMSPILRNLSILTSNIRYPLAVVLADPKVTSWQPSFATTYSSSWKTVNSLLADEKMSKARRSPVGSYVVGMFHREAQKMRLPIP